MAMAPSVVASACTVSFAVGRPAAASSARPRAAAGARVGVVRASAAKGGSGKWWAPLLGWSGKADCLGRIYWCPPGEAPAPAAQDEAAAARRQFDGVMTEEKAQELRARMAQTESFHDAM